MHQCIYHRELRTGSLLPPVQPKQSQSSSHDAQVGGMHTTTSTTAASATTTATSPTAASTAAATIAGHLMQARVNLLLGLGKNLDEITGLLGVCDCVSRIRIAGRNDTYSQ